MRTRHPPWGWGLVFSHRVPRCTIMDSKKKKGGGEGLCMLLKSFSPNWGSWGCEKVQTGCPSRQAGGHIVRNLFQSPITSALSSQHVTCASCACFLLLTQHRTTFSGLHLVIPTTCAVSAGAHTLHLHSECMNCTAWSLCRHTLPSHGSAMAYMIHGWADSEILP